jgi:hypothetical protein
LTRRADRAAAAPGPASTPAPLASPPDACGPAGLEADAVVPIGAAHWLRIPLGELRNDRYVPLHPELTALLAARGSSGS